MYDQTNQTLDQENETNFFDSDNLFTGDDDDVSESEDATASDDTNEFAGGAEGSDDSGAQAADKKLLSENAGVIIAKYNGAEFPIEREIAEKTAKALNMETDAYINTLQKGMNYDHIAEENKNIKNAPEFGILDRYAAMSGMSRQDYIKYLSENLISNIAGNELSALEEKYPDENPEILKELAEIRARENQRENERRQREAAHYENQQNVMPWQKLFLAFPELDPDSIPQSVYEDVENGMTPNESFLKYQNAQLNDKLNVIETNNKNSKKDTGALSGISDNKNDDFLSGFMD